MTDDEICGSTDTDSGEPCQRSAGWGRDSDTGPCIDHADEDGGTGRTSLLEQDESIIEVMAGALQAGATVPEACAEARISVDQYHKWRRRGDNDDAKELFRKFRNETARARRVAARQDRSEVKQQAKETGDTRTLYKIHHDQYGDTYDEEGGDGDAAEGIPLVVPDSAQPDP
ncbi:hypothetical protein ACFQL1_01500 [Halomicroarcula sp. GCM10025709]|uniref:hypothetical protein n=1 Tax=Haloarcula TaxID=2237 RepID=UPI0024C436F7|nr:hypothetical protein [Halomicroarcula sp. YJ-61-S]